jgi:anti-sigma factor RsiW
MTHADRRGHARAGDLGAHALGLLTPPETDAVDRHLIGCAECRLELAELRETAGVLDAVPPEMFLDGPPDTDLVLQRALRTIRAEAADLGDSATRTTDLFVGDRGVAPRAPVPPGRAEVGPPPGAVPLGKRPSGAGPLGPPSGAVPPGPASGAVPPGPASGAVPLGPRRERRERARSRRPVALVAAAVVAGGLLLGTGGVIGRVTAPETEITAAADGRVLEGSDGDVTMRTVVTPASGWVRLSAEVRGIPAGERCSLVVTSRDGSETVAGSWLTSAAGGVVEGSALVAPEDVVAVSVRNQGGQDFITLRA